MIGSVDQAVAAHDAWALSGAMWLTGRRDGEPLHVSHALPDYVTGWARDVARLSAELGTYVDFDGLALLGERAAIAGYRRNGSTSCGGATRLLSAADGWCAVTLSRDDDIAAIPAWLESGEPHGDLWRFVETAVRCWSVDDLRERATWLGLPFAALGETEWAPGDELIIESPLRDGGDGGGGGVDSSRQTTALSDVTVVDLSSMWAGPLCANILGLAGARIVKVESTSRPDGARNGPQAFFDLLHDGHECVAYDFTSPTGRAALRELLQTATVVIEGSRPRALRQLGIEPSQIATAGALRVWLSITAHGRNGVNAERVGFGDDAAVAGGLVAWEGDAPCFVADAVADPATGLLAAASVLEVLQTGGCTLLDVALARTAAALASGPTMDRCDVAVALPRARTLT